VSALVALGGCRRGDPEPPPKRLEPGEIEARTFSANASLMFVYAGISGRFENATAVADVPQVSRKVVRVIDPTASGTPRGDYDRVYVVDLRSPGDELAADVMSREAFERRALAALPPGEASQVEIPGAADGADPHALAEHDQIIVYGTSWCGACRQARTFLTQRGIPFVDRDVEKDAAAAAELAAKARAAGISADRVPIIDVRGKLMVGFDASRLSTLIGDQI